MLAKRVSYRIINWHLTDWAALVELCVLTTLIVPLFCREAPIKAVRGLILSGQLIIKVTLNLESEHILI